MQEGFDVFSLKNRHEPAPGMLLVANPFLPDGNFKRAVVLLTEHNEGGSVGFVINKPVDLTFTDIVPEFPIDEVDLGYGGPVQLDTLHFLHKRPDLFSDCSPIFAEVCWGGDFDELRTRMDTRELSTYDVRFFVGYAGWAPDQLDQEIEDESWLVVPATEDLVFEDSPEKLWRKVLKSLGGRYAVMAGFPVDPRMN